MFLIPKGLLKTNNTLCSLRNLLLLTCINLFRLKSNASALFFASRINAILHICINPESTLLYRIFSAIAEIGLIHLK